jgi:thermitase
VLDCGIFEPGSSNFQAPDGEVGHPDLRAGKVIDRVNFTSSNNTDDLCNHGTHVAGIAAANTNNTMGVAGIGFNSRIVNVKVLGDNSSGSFSDVLDGILWAAGCNGSTCGPRRADIINLSLGAQSSCSSAMQSAINTAWNQGLVIVAAAGNNNRSSGFAPANCNRVVAVSASTSSDSKASFSNFGSWVDVAAPGVGILSTDHAGTYSSFNGTSMASPHVAGLAALVWTTPYNTSNQAVVDRIAATAKKNSLAGSREGRVQAGAAVAPPVLPAYGVRWDAHTTPNTMDAGTTTNVDVSFTNTGSLTWPAGGPNPVRASYHWRSGSCASRGAYSVFEGRRTSVLADI